MNLNPKIIKKQYIKKLDEKIEEFYAKQLDPNKKYLDEDVIIYASKGEKKIMSRNDLKNPSEDEYVQVIRTEEAQGKKQVSRRIQIEADEIFSAMLSRSYNTIWKNKDTDLSKEAIQSLAQEALDKVTKARSNS